MSGQATELARRTKGALPGPRYRDRWRWELERSRARGWCQNLVHTANEVLRAREVGMIVGPARGSGEGCLLLWLLGANLFDPIERELDPRLFFLSDGEAPALSYWASADRPPLFVQHPSLAQGHAVPPPSLMEVKPPWNFNRWPSWRQILSHLAIDDLESRTVATALARPGPAGCGMLDAYLENPAQHRWNIFRDNPPGESKKSSVEAWRPYETTRGQAMSEALLYAAERGDAHIVLQAGKRAAKSLQQVQVSEGIS